MVSAYQTPLDFEASAVFTMSSVRAPAVGLCRDGIRELAERQWITENLSWRCKMPRILHEFGNELNWFELSWTNLYWEWLNKPSQNLFFLKLGQPINGRLLVSLEVWCFLHPQRRCRAHPPPKTITRTQIKKHDKARQNKTSWNI